MGNVIKHQTGYGQHPELFGRRYLPFHQTGRPGLIRKGNEVLEAPGFVLGFAQTNQMLDPLLEGFNMAEQHRGIGLQTEAMGDLMDFEPAVRTCFSGIQRLVQSFRKDFGASPR